MTTWDEPGSQEPQFSVVTPTLNAMGFLRGCVRSVATQGGVQVEHLVADGASQDGTVEWVEATGDLELISRRDNGMYDGLNQAFAASRGTYLSWLNCDERYQPHALAEVARLFAQTDCDLVIGNTLIVDRDGHPEMLRTGRPLRRRYVRAHILHPLSASMFFHRRLLDGGALTFDVNLRDAGDMDLVLRLLRRGVKIGYLDRVLAVFIDHGANMSRSAAAFAETERVRVNHGAPTRVVRPAVRLVRQLEREVRRLNSPRPLTYEWIPPDGESSEVRHDTVPVRRRKRP